MSTKLTYLFSVTLSFVLLFSLASGTQAAPSYQQVNCAQDYVVQANDWLSKLADKFLGDTMAYPLIFDATNQAAQADDSFAALTDPDLIEIGQKLCIPGPDDGQAMMMDEGQEMMVAGEPGRFTVRIENISDGFEFKSSGVFNTPLGADSPGPLAPGNAYEFTFFAEPGDALSFASMFVQSNDWFVAPQQAGIALYNADDMPVTGDISGQLALWDAGTEIDQEPGLGADQAPRQTGPNTGAADPDNTIRPVSDMVLNVPAITDQLRAVLESLPDGAFKLRLENISSEDTLVAADGTAQPNLFAPGVWAVHTPDTALFTAGQPDPDLGLEALAEDGNPANLATALANRAGRATPLAPGAWAVHTIADPFFTAGQIDRGQGLEDLAEDGDPAGLAAAATGREGINSAGVFGVPVGADEPGPLLPGNAYEFMVEVAPGETLSFATMYVQSNDLFFAPAGSGIALFTAGGAPVEGDITDQVALWDAGTEVNEAPNFGLNQAPRQAGPDTGPAENGVVQIVADGFNYPDTTDLIRVTISPQ